MRLYVKLILFILAAAGVQHFFLSNGQSSELWFGVRCSFAYVTHDAPMIQRLVDEAHLMMHPEAQRVNAAGG